MGDDAKRSKYDQLGGANWKQFQEGGAGFDFLNGHNREEVGVTECHLTIF